MEFNQRPLWKVEASTSQDHLLIIITHFFVNSSKYTFPVLAVFKEEEGEEEMRGEMIRST